MKKIYILLFACLAGVITVQAQRKFGAPVKLIKSIAKTGEFSTNGTQGIGCDTVNDPIPNNWNLAYYYADGALPLDSGYVSGTNAYNDQEKANYFDLSAQNYNYIIGTAVLFAVANTSTPSDFSKNVIFKVYADNNGTPGSQLGTSVSVPLSSINADVNAGVATNVIFSSPIDISASRKFYVSVDLSELSFANGGDSIAIFSTTDGDLAAGTGTAWEKIEDGTWYNFNQTWQFDAALAIFPYVSTTQGACGVLPVKLISFDAARQNKDAVINWKVAEEINMKGYQLEKAANDNNYKPVTFIPAHNDTKNVTYSYTDANAFANAANIQYRLKQIDNDGKMNYSKVISLKAASALNNIMFTNPFNGSLRMQLNLSNPSQVKINVYDVKGSLVGSEKPASYGASSSSINLKSTAGLKAGMYFIKLMVGNETYTYKVMKQ